MNPRLAVGFGERMVEGRSLPKGGEGVDSERELMLEDARSIREGMCRMAQLAQDATDSLDVQIEDEDLTGMGEAIQVREALERLRALSV